MNRPVRIQRKRAKGWRMPEGAIYVGRGTIWGNPFVVGQPCGVFTDDPPLVHIPALSLDKSLEFYRDLIGGFICPEMHPFGHSWMRHFQSKTRNMYPAEAARVYLKGRTLACWCDEGERCHGDILIEVANPNHPRL